MRGAGDGVEGRGRRWGGLALALLAAALLALSVFMPMLHCVTIRLRDNRLIDGWEGIALIGCAALAVLGAVLGVSRRRWGWLDCAAGVAAFGVVIYASSGSRLIVQGPVPGIEGAARAEPGIGLLVAGLGGLVAIGAGLMLGLAGRSATAEMPMPAKVT